MVDEGPWDGKDKGGSSGTALGSTQPEQHHSHLLYILGIRVHLEKSAYCLEGKKEKKKKEWKEKHLRKKHMTPGPSNLES